MHLCFSIYVVGTIYIYQISAHNFVEFSAEIVGYEHWYNTPKSVSVHNFAELRLVCQKKHEEKVSNSPTQSY